MKENWFGESCKVGSISEMEYIYKQEIKKTVEKYCVVEKMGYFILNE